MAYLYEEGDMIKKPVECFYHGSFTDVGFPVHPHWHYYTEILYIFEGTALLEADGKSFEANEGDLVIFYPQVVHSINARGYEKHAVFKFDVNVIGVSSPYAPKLRKILKCAARQDMPYLFTPDQTKPMGMPELAHECIAEMQELNYGYDMIVRSNLYKLLTFMVRNWVEKGLKLDDEIFMDESYDIYSITEYIDKGIASGIKTTDIAKACGMSYAYFAKRFLAVYGKTCKAYIEEMRIYKVEEFLMFTDFDLTYIAQETGFADCSHMIKDFKKHRGITPKQFRLKRLREEEQAAKAEEDKQA
ncbi:MAG: AraC family transcriptional regulator [Lachnospiraceae bacterium]|nr:AraC family transcriptional regulator [Lachnospiraceae bacterium]